ncbi:MAG: glycosyltransferase family 4 protein [Bacteroidia bacterium]|nr:glycosyltransferase family 4 protein [Bacteroidia bacterium]
MSSIEHVLMITPGFPADEGDSTCIPALQEYVLALRVSHPGLKISVIALQYPNRRGSYEWNGIPVFAAGGNNKGGFGRIFAWRRAKKAIKAIHKENPVSLVHSFWMTEAAMLGHSAAFKLGARHINTLMGQDARSTNAYLRLLATARIPAIALTPFQAQVYQESSGQEPATIIPWGLPRVEDDLTGPRPVDVLGVGSLIPLKGWEDFIETCAELVKQKPDLRAEIIGDGPEKGWLQRKIEDLGLEEQVSLRGQLVREKVLERMTQSRVLLHPAEYESFGLVFAEAQSRGMHLVSRPVGAVLPGPTWRTGESPAEFAREVQALLEIPPATHPEPLYPIQSTVDAYWKFYQS